MFQKLFYNLFVILNAETWKILTEEKDKGFRFLKIKYSAFYYIFVWFTHTHTQKLFSQNIGNTSSAALTDTLLTARLCLFLLSNPSFPLSKSDIKMFLSPPPLPHLLIIFQLLLGCRCCCFFIGFCFLHLGCLTSHPTNLHPENTLFVVAR